MAGDNDNDNRDPLKDGDRITPSPGYHASVRPPSTVSELGAFLVDMQKATTQGFATVLREQSKTNDRLTTLEGTVSEHNDLIDEIAAEVFSMPPPGGGTSPSSARVPPARVAARLVKRRPRVRDRAPSLTSRTDGLEAKLDELAGAVVAARAEAQTAREAAEAAEKKTETVEVINKQQSRAMGLSRPEASAWRKFVNLALSREGLKLAGGFVTAIAALAAAIASGRASSSAERAADRPAAVSPAMSSTPAP